MEILTDIPVSLTEEESVILKITFENNLQEAKTYYSNHQRFLEYLEDVRSVPPYYQASYFNNFLYIWTTKYSGQWIIEFLTTFEYKPNKLISIEYREKAEETTEYKQIKDKLPQQTLGIDVTKVRFIFMKISSSQMQYNSEEFFKPAIEKIRKLTTINDDFTNILQENNIIYSKDIIQIIAKTSMAHANRLRDLLNTFHSNVFPSLKLRIFDDYVKVNVVGVTFTTTVDKLEKVLTICLRKTSLNISEWFVAEYKEPSIFIYVPKQDAEVLKLCPKFLLKGKFIIKFIFIDQNY